MTQVLSNEQTAAAAANREEAMADTPSTPPAEMGQTLGGTLCSVSVVVCRPLGRVRIKNFVVEAKADDGQTKQVGKTTNPQIPFDDTTAWKAIDANEREIRGVIDRYTAKNLQRGAYLMSALEVGPFVVRLQQLRDRRLELARVLRTNWYNEVLPEVERQYPDHYNVLRQGGHLEAPGVDAFDVLWEFHPLATLRGEDLDLTKLSKDEQTAVIRETNEKVKELFTKRMSSIFDGVFGAVLELCDDIDKGGFETGTRRQGSIDEILTVLDRVQHFSANADAATIQRVAEARELVAGLQITDVNRNLGNVQTRLRMAFGPVRDAVKKLQERYQPGGSRQERVVNF